MIASKCCTFEKKKKIVCAENFHNKKLARKMMWKFANRHVGKPKLVKMGLGHAS